MNRVLLPTVLLLLMLAPPRARAEDPRPTKIGAGFHNYLAPIGVRWWIGENHALDLNVGFRSDESNGERLDQYNFQVGVPIVVGRYGRLAAEVRPGLGYEIQHSPVWNGFAYVVSLDHLIEPQIEFEAEVMVIDHLSLSGAFGLSMIARTQEATDDTQISWATSGGNFANVGFHFYFGGPK